MNWDSLHRTLQFTGAALAIPAAAAGTYTAYRTYFSLDAACQNLQGSIVAIMERNIPAETKRGLLHKDVAEFEKMCAKADPESWVVFQAAIKPDAKPQTSPVVASAPARAAQAGATALPRAIADAFGVSPSGDLRGWVALMRREPGKDPESHFDGYTITDATLPAAGSTLTARRLIPVWREPLPPGPNPPDKLQGRLVAGGCVRVLSTRPGVGRNWAEVVPINCT